MTLRAEEIKTQGMAAGLDRADLDPNPYRQFEDWFAAAIESGIPEPNAMSLATVDEDGQPWVRTVLLKTYDERGFVFFTNYESRKARHIEHNARVALSFPWYALGREVKISGEATRISFTESAQYFATRPRGSQIGAWASPQSRVISSRSLLEAKFEEMKRKLLDHEVPLPAFWGGYRVRPTTIEFWQARSHRLHDRFLYTRDEPQGTWHIDRLAP
ncbi:MAG: pyridoxamine 5'-phosphate oxidase [Gammaproteobacteria bacterium]|jgi:pyridoxamine 5'-phosphate oxidase